jgi:hypothetical protein
MPNMQAGYCPGGGMESQISLAYCDGVPYLTARTGTRFSTERRSSVTRINFFRRAFSVLCVLARSPSQHHRAAVVGPHHRRHLRSSARECLRISRPEC